MGGAAGLGAGRAPSPGGGQRPADARDDRHPVPAEGQTGLARHHPRGAVRLRRSGRDRHAINQGEVYRFVGKPWKDEALKTTIRQCFEHFDILQENLRLTRQTQLQVHQLQNLNNLLEASVEVRTLKVQFSQEVVENLPLMILGISHKEVVLTNGWARSRLEALRTVIPGTEMDAILPPDAVAAIRSCMTTTKAQEFSFSWGGMSLKARPSILGTEDSPRGCVLLLEEVPS